MTSQRHKSTANLPSGKSENLIEEEEETGENVVLGSTISSVDSVGGLLTTDSKQSESDVADKVCEQRLEERLEEESFNNDIKQADRVLSQREETADAVPIRRLHPFVNWAQSQTHISLRIDLVEVENLNVNLSDDGLSLTFSAQGKGAQGLQDYYFSLQFYSQVDNKFDCHAIERYVLVLIKKSDQQLKWPRLTKQSAKLPWLRVDFDRYTNEDSDSVQEDSETDELEKGNKEFLALQQQLKEAKENCLEGRQSYTSSNSLGKSLDNPLNKKNSKKNLDIFNPFNKKFINTRSKSGTNTSGLKMKYDYRKETVATDNSKNTARHALDFKKTYLFLYNLVMFIMFLKVYLVLVLKNLSGTIDDDIVQGAAFIIKLLTYTQLLETIHPILGLVPGGPLMPFTQVIGRLLVNHFLTDSKIRVDSAPYAHYLFIVWSSIEIFRYSFYALRVFKVNIYPLTWCRYTLFLPLYPMGGFCESMVLFSTIKEYEKTGQYSVSLPNSANISFSLPIVLRIYIFLLLGPTIYLLMKYMWRQRCKQLKEKTA